MVSSRSFRSRKETLGCCDVDRRYSSYPTSDLVTGITREYGNLSREHSATGHIHEMFEGYQNPSIIVRMMIACD